MSSSEALRDWALPRVGGDPATAAAGRAATGALPGAPAAAVAASEASTGAGPAAWQPPAVRLDRRPSRPMRFDTTLADGRDPAAVAAEADVRRRAYDDGYRAGREDASVDLREALAALSHLVGELAESKGALLKDLEANLTAVALSAARHLIGREVATDPAIVSELVTRGIDLVKPESPLTLRLNPADLEAVREHLTPALDHESMTVRWLTDESIARGGYELESPGRLIDGRLEEALRALYERLVYE